MIIAANLKTNLTRHDTASYIEEVDKCAKQSNQEVFVFPAISSLDSFSAEKVEVGTQNAYPTVNGAFTGEIGLEQLEEFGIKTILIGHSERRHILGETQEFIAKKFAYFKEQGFTIVYCVGEPKEKREAGKEAMMEYISAQYEGIDTSYEKLIIAYEPVWAIGTGLTPTLEDIEDIHTELKQKSSAPLLYGGSVKVTNAKEVLSLKNVDGILVGSAALYAEHFCTMIQYADEIEK
ncbi:triose-phosphate isomerase [Sulfurimonas paralvinellae]|uniref:Triosephosphate isomerase n=1 Tax=Sulfurimonas paralvinellae TaxID=317658 RepID=A0A7M1B5W0_9BACT|nr:triose-phosphate isomerase [Sulfurimonas paralvinellae]QOP45117.1 triose-phosphate isomerase [Sulfurimonas paralvinellae]